MAKQAYNDKKYYEVIDYANKSIAAAPNGAAYWYRGMGRYYVNNYIDAADDFTKAISYYGTDNSSLSTLYYWRALCRYSQNNYQESLPDFESAKYYGYDDKMNMYWSMAYANYRIKEYQKSIDLYTTAMTYTNDNATLSSLYSGRADGYRKQ